MEIIVTRLVTEGNMFEFSASRAERGMNAGPETWNNAKDEAAERPILGDDELPEFRDYVREFGAWDDAEIDGWDATECNALFVQMVAGDIREIVACHPGDGPGDIDWAAYEADENMAGRMFLSGDDIYYYVGN